MFLETRLTGRISQVGEMECEGKVVSLTTIGMSGGYMGEKQFNKKYGKQA
jgi:hypothetical protein